MVIFCKTNKGALLKNIFVILFLSCFAFNLQAQIIVPPDDPLYDVSLISTQAYANYVIKDDDFIQDGGSFSISIKVTAIGEDIFVHRDYNLLDNYDHYIAVSLNGNQLSSVTAARAYLVGIDSSGDTSEWYQILDGESRNFQFILGDFVPQQTGIYRMELSSLHVAFGTTMEDGWMVVDSSTFRTNSLFLQGVPEPNCILLVTIGILSIVYRRKVTP